MTRTEPPRPIRRAGPGQRGAWCGLLLAAAMLPAGGCASPADGYPRVPLEGVVTLDGEYLDTGTINLIPLEKGAEASGEIVAGRFHLSRSQGPSPGPYRVEVYSVRSTGRKVPDSDNPKELVDERTNVIPANYNVRSELKLEIPQADRSPPRTIKLFTKKAPRGG